MTAAASVSSFSGRLAILAGRGRFPLIVARAAREQACDPFILAIEGEADQDWKGFDHAQVPIGNLAEVSALLRRERIGAVVMAGGIARRPRLADIRPSWASLRAAPSALKALLSGGDDSVLRAAIRVIENHGVRVLGAQEIAPGLLGAPGPLGRHAPQASDRSDMTAAIDAALALGRLDIGQGAVSAGGRVVALEGLEGTDAMLARVAELRANGRLRTGARGVLAKMCKPTQDERADLPSIGPETVINAHAAGLAGIALEAGRSLVLDREELIAKADRLGLFVTGIIPSDYTKDTP